MGPSPRAPKVHQISWPTHARVRWPAWSICSPGRLGSVNEAPPCIPVFPGISGTVPRAHAVEHLSWVTRSWSEGLWCQPAEPNNSGLGPRDRNVDQLSRATKAGVRGTAGSTSCFWGLGNETQFLQCRTAAPGTSGLSPRAPRLDQLSWYTHARVGGPAGSTSSPGRLGHRSEGPCC